VDSVRVFEVKPPVATGLGARTQIRRHPITLPLAVIDAALIYVAFMLAYWLRYILKVGPHIQQQISFQMYQPVVVLLLAIMLPTLLIKGAYRARMSTELMGEFATIFSAGTISVALLVVTTAILRHWVYSRGVVVYVWLLVIVLVAMGRAAYRGVQAAMYRRGWGVRRLLVIGATEAGKMVMQSVMNRRGLGYELVGFVEHRETPHMQDFGRFRAVGSLADIPDLIEKREVDEIIMALPAAAHEDAWPILRLCEARGIAVKVVPDLFEMNLSRVQVDSIGGIPLLDVQEKPLRRVARATKRAMDIVISVILLIASAPLLAVLAALIRAESPGPALLRQARIGLLGREFYCYKLRTMRLNAADLQSSMEPFNEAQGPLFKIRNDPRRTRVGRRIRRWSLDELPQLWNVLKGDMSLVGPRPPLPTEVVRYEPSHQRRLEVKPGMTGVWQVSGRSDLHFDEMVVMDTSYVDYWSLGLDVKILVRTAIAVLTRNGAY